MKRILGLTAICAVLFFTGCSDKAVPADGLRPTAGYSDEDSLMAEPEPEEDITNVPAPDQPPDEPAALPVSELVKNSVYPYEVGQIMVIMYHGIFEEPPVNPYHRSAADFKKDLQALYDGGYRLISMSDLIDNNIGVPAGYTPVVLSFDDGLSASFSLVEENGRLVPAPGCGVDILTEFAEEHPDFGNAAVFYINGNTDIFKGSGTLAERLQYLVDHGYELGNHTYSHADLSRLGAEGIQEEIGKVEELVRGALPGYEMRSLSYPNGTRPREELREYALSGGYNGIAYSYSLAVREGQSGASAAPNHVKFDPTNVPRVRGSEGEDTDLWWSLEVLERQPERRYVSDGDPGRIAVPEEYADNVNADSLNSKELVLYSTELEQ